MPASARQRLREDPPPPGSGRGRVAACSADATSLCAASSRLRASSSCPCSTARSARSRACRQGARRRGRVRSVRGTRGRRVRVVRAAREGVCVCVPRAAAPEAPPPPPPRAPPARTPPAAPTPATAPAARGLGWARRRENQTALKPFGGYRRWPCRGQAGLALLLILMRSPTAASVRLRNGREHRNSSIPCETAGGLITYCALWGSKPAARCGSPLPPLRAPPEGSAAPRAPRPPRAPPPPVRPPPPAAPPPCGVKDTFKDHDQKLRPPSPSRGGVVRGVVGGTPGGCDGEEASRAERVRPLRGEGRGVST